jgi:hypothetical protein
MRISNKIRPRRQYTYQGEKDKISIHVEKLDQVGQNLNIIRQFLDLLLCFLVCGVFDCLIGLYALHVILQIIIPVSVEESEEKEGKEYLE